MVKGTHTTATTATVIVVVAAVNVVLSSSARNIWCTVQIEIMGGRKSIIIG